VGVDGSSRGGPGCGSRAGGSDGTPVIFQANDGEADSSVATVSLTVMAVNDAPVALDQSVTTRQETPVSITLEATDPDGDPLSFVVISSPAHGTLSGAPP
jgi:hypothetical protein